MRTSRSSTLLKIVVAFFGLAGSAIALDETAPSPVHAQHSQINGINLEEPSGKRAYTYVSEYKRLPVYKFGIGKRWVDTSDDKKRSRSYNFGLGKRSEGDKFRAMGLSGLDYPLPAEPYENPRRSGMDEPLENKRAGYAYRFGLGKRAWLASAEAMGEDRAPNEELLNGYNLKFEKREEEDNEEELSQ